MNEIFLGSTKEHVRFDDGSAGREANWLRKRDAVRSGRQTFVSGVSVEQHPQI